MFRKFLWLSAPMILALALFSEGAQAMFARYSDAQLIETSALIAVGTVTRITKVVRPSDGRERTVGIIEIETLLKGAPGTNIARLDLPQRGVAIKSTDIHYKVGQKGLWFLRRVSQGPVAIYTADHPQRFVPFASAGPHIEGVRKFLKR